MNNPFQPELDEVEARLHIQYPSWVFPVFSGIAVWRGLAMLTCLAIALLPFYRGPASRKQHSWLFRTYYLQDRSQMPYLVPNRSMVISICEFLSNGTYMLLACFHYLYFSGNGHESDAVYATICSGFGWLPSYVGIWLAGWGLLYACLCDVQGKRRGKSKILTPLVYNAILISYPIITIASISYLAVMVGVVEKDLITRALRLIYLLKQAVMIWKTKTNSSELPISELLRDGRILLKDLEILSNSFRQMGSLWLGLGVILTTFYLSATYYFFKTCRRMLSTYDVQQLTCPGTRATLIHKELTEEYKFLMTLSLIISTTLGLDLLVGVFWMAYSHHFTARNWILTMGLVSHFPGIVMSPSLLFQSWRILTERNAASETTLHEAKEFEKTRYVQDMASQLLGWDNTIHWGQDSLQELDNFSGLRAIKRNGTDGMDESKHGSSGEENYFKDIAIHIRQSVVSVRHDDDATPLDHSLGSSTPRKSDGYI